MSTRIFHNYHCIASKLGDINAFGADPRRVAKAGHDVENIEPIDYGKKYSAQNNAFKARFDSLDSKFNGKSLDDYVNGKSFCCGENSLDEIEKNNNQGAENAKFEDNLYFYHPDHLGSTSMVTNYDGEVTQNVAYIPYGEVFVEERNGSWATPFLFNAKELDEETGLYYYGARYLNPTDARWLAVDPVFHPGSSPYAYCMGNPVKLVDPNGENEYEVDTDGNVFMVKESEKHTIFALDKNGRRTGKSLNVKDKKILDDLAQQTDIQQQYGKYNGDYSITKSSEVGNIFTFLADNTDVEWGLSKYKSGEYGISTSHKHASVTALYSMNSKSLNEDNLLYSVHSHPSADGTKGGSYKSHYNLPSGLVQFNGGDMGNLSNLANRFNRKNKYTEYSFPKFFVYHTNSRNLYQYTPYENSLFIGNISKKSILNYINYKSYGSLYKAK